MKYALVGGGRMGRRLTTKSEANVDRVLWLRSVGWNAVQCDPKRGTGGLRPELRWTARSQPTRRHELRCLTRPTTRAASSTKHYGKTEGPATRAPLLAVTILQNLRESGWILVIDEE